MMKVCGKMLSKVRLEQNWGESVYKRAIYYKISHFYGNLEIPCVVPKSPCFPCLEKVITKLPVFPVPWPPCMNVTTFCLNPDLKP